MKEKILKILRESSIHESSSDPWRTVEEDVFDDMSDDIINLFKSALTDYTDFLLKNGYCDTDVYDEPPSAIDRFLYPEIDK